MDSGNGPAVGTCRGFRPEGGRSRAGGYFLAWDPKTAPYGKFERYNGYVGFLFTAGLEICHHYLEYYAITRTPRFFARRRIRWCATSAGSSAHLLRKGRRRPLSPRPGQRPGDLVAGPRSGRHAGRHPGHLSRFMPSPSNTRPTRNCAQKCAEILAHLPEPPRGHWDRTGEVTRTPTPTPRPGALGPIRESRNFEIPALYRVYPFGLSGIGSADRDVCVHTFNRRIFGITNSWSLDAVWAARLGLADEAARLLGEHAERYHRFPYGGWDSSNSSVLPGGLSACPYVDGAGLSAFCLQEMLLQSHEEAIRVLPATPKTGAVCFDSAHAAGFLFRLVSRKGCRSSSRSRVSKGAPWRYITRGREPTGQRIGIRRWSCGRAETHGQSRRRKRFCVSM